MDRAFGALQQGAALAGQRGRQCAPEETEAGRATAPMSSNLRSTVFMA